MFDVITFGAATRDCFLFSKDELDIEKDKHSKTGQAIALPLEAKLELSNIVFSTGGGATNAAVTFSRQGLRSACVCKIGFDPGGKAILGELHDDRVETIFISKDHEVPTGYSIILDVGKKGRTVLVYRGASERLEKSDIDFNSINSKWFYITSLGAKDLDLLEVIIDFASKNGIKTAIDPHSSLVKLGSAKLSGLLGKISVFKCNLEEASYLTGIDYKKPASIFKKMDKLVNGIVVITDGPNGVAVSDGKHIFKAGIFKEKEVADRTGAGDAFGSGFISALIRETSIEEAIRVGSANATSVVEYIGAKKGILNLEKINDQRWKKLDVKKQTQSK